MTPREAITAFCKECVGSYTEIKECRGDQPLYKDDPCPFFPLRLGKGRASMKKIRKLCLGCMQGSSSFVTYCPSEKCILYFFRFGKKIL